MDSENVPSPVSVSRPMKMSEPMPAASSPGTSTSSSVAPPSPDASISRNAPSSGDSRMTIVTHGDEATLEQIVKQLNKLPDVIKVHDFEEGEYVDRELVLVKVSVESKTRAEVMQITDIFRAKIVDVQSKSLSVEVTGTEDKVQKFLELMKPFGITDLTRTGKVALPRK